MQTNLLAKSGALSEAVGQNRADIVNDLLLARSNDVGQAWADEVNDLQSRRCRPHVLCRIEVEVEYASACFGSQAEQSNDAA